MFGPSIGEVPMKLIHAPALAALACRTGRSQAAARVGAHI
jgi:hypothetical protein